MLGRAELFRKAGYSVLLFDFQAHGESIGKQITLGWLESRDAQAAVKFAKEKCPGEKIGVVGVSLGGAAAVLADPHLAVDAYVLELVYSNVEDAISNRIKIVLGPIGGIFTPLLSCQIKPRLGISTDQLRPEYAVHSIPQPKLFLAGAQDKHSTIEQSRRLFQAAAEPKELVVFEGASHEDLCWGINSDLYKRSVLRFFEKHLRQ
jgi:alpha-beta hydrolase superfamily lysophospholipase